MGKRRAGLPRSRGVCSWGGSVRLSAVPGGIKIEFLVGLGVFTVWRVSGLTCSIPAPCLLPHPPFLQAQWEYLLHVSAMFCLKCLCATQTAAFGFLQPLVPCGGVRGALQPSSIPGKMGLCWGFLFVWVFFPWKTTSLPHHFCPCAVALGLLTNLAKAASAKY